MNKFKIKKYYEKEAEYFQNHQKNLYCNDNYWISYAHKRRMTLVNHYLKNAINLLEVGCAEGRYFKHKKIDCVGIDISKGYIYKAKNNVKYAHYLIADACYLPFKKDSFDYILISEVLEHVPNWEKTIKELSYVGRTFIITVPLLNLWTGIVNIIKNKKNIFNKPGKGHINTIWLNHLKFELKKSKIIIQRIHGISWFPTYSLARLRLPLLFLKIISIFDNGLFKFPRLSFLAMNVLIKAKIVR